MKTHHTGARRLITLALTAGLLTGGMAPAIAAPSAVEPQATLPAATDCAAAPFPDNRPGTAYYTAVRWAQCAGLVSGYRDGTFGMKEPISRNETAQILFRYRDPSWTAPTTSPFHDLSTGSVFYNAVTWGNSAKVITGFADKTWRGHQSITRAHTAALLRRLSGSEWTAPRLDPFQDTAYGAAQYADITWLNVNGIAQGYGDRLFGVRQNITRAELVTMLYRMHTLDGSFQTAAPWDYGTVTCRSVCTQYTTGTVNLRRGPSTENTIRATLAAGTKVSIQKVGDGWVYVTVGDKTGWVSSAYLSRSAPRPPEPPKPPAPTQYPLAVYGTLRNGQSAYFLLKDKTTSEVTVRVNGYGLWLRPGYSWWSFMIPSTSSDSVVVERMKIRSSQYASTLREVDEWERYDPSKPLASQNYNRKLVTDRQGVRAWSYIAGSQMASYVKSNGTKIIGGDFLKRF